MHSIQEILENIFSHKIKQLEIKQLTDKKLINNQTSANKALQQHSNEINANWKRII